MVVVEVNGYTIGPGADLSRANLSGANLNRANLTEADLYGANLYRANLYRANLTRANLTEADLYGANLTEANLRKADLTRVKADEHTVLPEGYAAELKQVRTALKKLAAKKAEESKTKRISAEELARYMRSSDAIDTRDGVSSFGDPGSGTDQSEFCPSCGVRVRADGSCLC